MVNMVSNYENDPLSILGGVIRKHCQEIGKSFLSTINDTDIVIKNFTIDRKAKTRIYKCIVHLCHSLIVIIPNNPEMGLDEIIQKSHIKT